MEVNVITPTTKSAEHDVPISAKEIVRQGLMTPAEWDEASLFVPFNSMRLLIELDRSIGQVGLTALTYGSVITYNW